MRIMILILAALAVTACAQIDLNGPQIALFNPKIVVSTSAPCNNNVIATIPTGTTRNDFAGWVGCTFTPNVTNITICSLSRLCVHTGDSQSHTIYICSGSGSGTYTISSVLASATVSMSGISSGATVSTSVSTVTLTAGTKYVLLCAEFNGGDLWYDRQSVTAYSSIAINGAAYCTSTPATSVAVTESGAGQMYGIQNALFQ